MAQTIAQAQRSLGHDVNVLSVVGSDLRSEPLKKPLLTVAAALDEWVLSSHRENTLFSPLRGNLESLDSSKIRPDSIIHLHWMPGVLVPESIRKYLDGGRKVVWTLHDMNPFTGGCHYAHDCTGFSRGCENCPQAKGVFRRTVSMNLMAKSFTRIYPRLRIVSPTDWMANQVRISSAFSGQKSLVVPNPIDEVFFSGSNSSSPMVEPKPSKTEFVAVTIAKDLREPRKNIDFVVRALEKASFDSGQKITLILIGQNGGAFSSSKVRLVWLGELSADKIVGRIASADVLLSGSLAESAGMTVVECAAMGIPSVALENGGTASLIRDGVSGILARDFDSFTSGVVDLIQSPRKLSTLGASALKSSELHRPTAVGRKYLEVYESMT